VIRFAAHEAPSTGNPLIQQLQRQSGMRGETSADYLLIAHNDLPMLRALARALDTGSTATLQVPQSDWNFHDPMFAEVLDWTIREMGVASLILCGHSNCLLDDEATPTTSSHQGTGRQHPRNRASGGRKRLLEGVKDQQARAQLAKRYLAEQLRNLSNLCRQQELAHLAGGNVEVLGLLYMAQSGTFYVYDADQQQFFPLLHTFNGHGVIR